MALPNPCWAQSEDSQNSKEDEQNWYVNGYLDFHYTWRFDDEGDSDQKLYEILSLSFGDKKSGWITGYISARLAQDLDGFDNPDPYLSIENTHDRFYPRLNAAYVDLRPGWNFLEVARLGRQWLSDIPVVIRMDGIRLETPPMEHTFHTRVILFGGIPWYVNESSRSEKRVYGLGFEFRPWDLTRFSVFYTRLNEVYDQEWVNASNEITARDDLVSFDLRQNFLQNLMTFYGTYSNLNGDSRDSQLRLAYNSEDGRWGAALNYRILYTTQKAQSIELDPYFSVLRSYYPYQELGFDVRRFFTDKLSADLGASFRRVSDDSDRGPFNHDFNRFFLTGTVQKWPLEGSEIALTGNLYDANEGDKFWAVEGSWSQDLSEDLSGEVGTSYALYHLDRFTINEREHIRSVFLLFDYDLVKDVSLRGGYTLEVGDDMTWNRVDIGVQFRF